VEGEKIHAQEILPIDECQPSWRSYLKFCTFRSRPWTCCSFRNPSARQLA
jgi:hypothetical protein